MPVELTVSNLTKAFLAARPVVDDVSFVAAPGEIVVLLGPSGCGKTTTMRAVAGLEKPTDGQIRIGNEVVSDPRRAIFIKTQKRNVGMVFQSYAVWPHMTVGANVRYPLLHRRLGKAEMEKRVVDALAVVNLSDYADRPATALSGGQMQRVALARSLVYHPSILLLDEPLSNLDAKLRLRLRDDLRRIIKEAGVTALYVTHDQSEAVAVADRIGVMRDGKLLQMATASALYNSPGDLFVAEFLGATNQLVGQVARYEGGIAAIAIDGVGELKARVHVPVAVGEKLVLAVRPENVRLTGPDSPESPTGDWNRIAGKVLEVRFQGVQTGYRVGRTGLDWEAIEYGSMAQHESGSDVAIWVPLDGCWAFPVRTQ